MAPRAIASGTVSFGLVSIPVKVYTATASQKVHFHMLDQKTGGRVKQQYVSAASGEIVERQAMMKGYEYARGQFVTLAEDELKALEAERSNTMDIVEFVPLETVDLVQVEKSYYLGPDKGGDKAYRLLTQAMKRKGRVAVGRWAARGKEQLVLIRPYRRGLILHQMFYANEMRAADEIELGAEYSFGEPELDLADKLIDQLSSGEFMPEKYVDGYTERVRQLVEQKVAGQEITVAPEAPKAQIIDLFEALKQSLDQAKGPPAAPSGAEDIEPRPVKKASPRRSGSKAKKSSTA
jgi:DNA end-binding protein Ku